MRQKHQLGGWPCSVLFHTHYLDWDIQGIIVSERSPERKFPIEKQWSLREEDLERGGWRSHLEKDPKSSGRFRISISYVATNSGGGPGELASNTKYWQFEAAAQHEVSWLSTQPSQINCDFPVGKLRSGECNTDGGNTWVRGRIREGKTCLKVCRFLLFVCYGFLLLFVWQFLNKS